MLTSNLNVTAATHIPAPPRKAASDASAPCHACVQISRQKFEKSIATGMDNSHTCDSVSTVSLAAHRSRKRIQMGRVFLDFEKNDPFQIDLVLLHVGHLLQSKT